MTITLRNEPCDCASGVCLSFVEPAEDCINRLRGEVVTRHCEVCDPGGQASSWHHDGRCLRCVHLGLHLLPAQEPTADDDGDQDRSGPEQS